MHSPYMWGYFHLTTFLTTSSRLPHDLRKNLTTFQASREVVVRGIYPPYTRLYAMFGALFPYMGGKNRHLTTSRLLEEGVWFKEKNMVNAMDFHCEYVEKLGTGDKNDG